MLKKFWDISKNSEDFNSVGKTSRRVFNWVCPDCNFSWEEEFRLINYRVNKCPVCSGSITKAVSGITDLSTLRPDLIKDWDWKLNTKDPSTLKLSSHYVAHWVCHKCGHRWSNRLDTRTKNGCGCPVCARKKISGCSIADYTLYKLVESSLRGSFEVFYRRKVLGLEVDIFIPFLNICIEYDGWVWHNKEDKREHDNYKDRVLQENGYTVYRIKERSDKILSVDYQYPNTAYTPTIREDNYDEVKKLFADILQNWGVVDSNNISKEYWNLSRLKVKSIISKPPYELSFKYFLENSSYDKMSWDYNKNEVEPEDLYSRSKEKVFMKCKKGHSVLIRISSITRGNNGCKYCNSKVVI